MNIKEIASKYSNSTIEEQKEIINNIIIELEHINKQHDNSRIIDKVLDGEEDERDYLIDIILWDNDIRSFIERYNNKYKYFYYKMYGDIDFVDIIHKLLKIILKKLTFHEEIKSPIGYLINKCFVNKTLSDGKIIISYVDSYFNRYKSKFQEMILTTSIDAKVEYEMNDNSDIIIDESEFNMEYHENITNLKDKRDGLNKKKLKEYIEYDKLDIKKTKNNGRMLDIDISEEDKDIQNDILEQNNDNFIYEIDDECTNNFKYNNFINIFSIDYDNFKLKYFGRNNKNNEWDKIGINKLFDDKLNKLLWHWNIYKKNIGYIPHDIFKLNSKNYIHYDTSKVIQEEDKNIKQISSKYKQMQVDLFINCPVKSFEFDLVLKEKNVDDYIKNIIITNLSKREALLIGLMFYEMKSQQNIMEILEYDYRDIDNFNKFKHKAIKKIKLALLKDYDYIVKHYEYTYLVYWLRRLNNKINNIK